MGALVFYKGNIFVIILAETWRVQSMDPVFLLFLHQWHALFSDVTRLETVNYVAPLKIGGAPGAGAGN